ncbi:hypothetical protein BGX27_008503 [Mortierella sp. AM989]|nr:hypothetical protein BGX27_008503 [Mortierella sp. AM989]
MQEPFLRYSGENDEQITPQEYRLRVGKAIRTLQEELPQFFQQGLCTTSIYASNIRLIEASHTNVSLQGKPIYILLAGAVRWSFKMWFRDLEFEIQSIRVNDRGGRGIKGMDSGSDFGGGDATSFKSHFRASDQSTLTVPHQHFTNGSPIDSTYHSNPQKSNIIVSRNYVDRLEQTVNSLGTRGGGRVSDGEKRPLPPATTVTVRWTMKGTTRPSIILTSAGPAPPPPSSFAGVFVYQFNDFGFIDEHRIENIMPSPSPEAIQRAFAWWGWLLSRTRPTAAAAASEETESRKRLGLGYITNK